MSGDVKLFLHCACYKSSLACCELKHFATPLRPIRDDAARLLLVQGPLGLNWRWRKWGVLPKVEKSKRRTVKVE